MRGQIVHHLLRHGAAIPAASAYHRLQPLHVRKPARCSSNHLVRTQDAVNMVRGQARVFAVIGYQDRRSFNAGQDDEVLRIKSTGIVGKQIVIGKAEELVAVRPVLGYRLLGRPVPVGVDRVAVQVPLIARQPLRQSRLIGKMRHGSSLAETPAGKQVVRDRGKPWQNAPKCAARAATHAPTCAHTPPPARLEGASPHAALRRGGNDQAIVLGNGQEHVITGIEHVEAAEKRIHTQHGGAHAHGVA